MKILPQLFGFAAVIALLIFQPLASGGTVQIKQREGKGGKATPSATKNKKPKQNEAFSWDVLAEPGRTAADTLRRLREGVPEVLPHGLDPNDPGNWPRVTITPPTAWTVPPGATGFNITFSPAETGIVVNGIPYSEQFALMLPAGYNPQNPPPLVVAWHGFGNSHNQPMPYLANEANNRGWMLMSPLGIADNTFSWLPGQIAVSQSLDWLATNHPFDGSRVYGVGFSMGAMCITNYAARHLDPNKTRFAALATVCGTFDNVDNYTQSPSAQTLMESFFGGNPYSAPQDFEYLRTSLLRLQAPLFFPYPPVEGVTLARTIARTPLYMTWSTDDNVVPYSPIHNTSLAEYFASLGFTPTQHPKSGLLFKHHWSVLNVVNCFNFFTTKTLDANPADISIVADIQGQFHFATASGGSPAQFRRFDVGVNVGNSNLQISSSTNIDSLVLDLSGFAISPNADLLMSTTTLDLTSDVITLNNPATPLPPSKVKIDAGTDYGWVYDGVSSVTFTAPAGFHSEEIRYNTFDFNLAISGTPSIGSTVSIDTSNGADGDAYWTLVSETQGLTPLSLVGDGDPRWLLIDLATSYVVYSGVLSGGGQDSVPAAIPNDPMLVGVVVYLQNVTAPGAVSGIPFFFGRISNGVALTIQ
ncbi:MAG: alpha/beta fold hydrolase [Planctomycetota bacterium]